MRLLIAAILVGAMPTLGHADLPVALRVSGGVGIGAGFRSGSVVGPFGAIAAADLLIRGTPGRAYLLSYEVGGAGTPGAQAYSLEHLEGPLGTSPPRLEGTSHQAVLAGIERSHSWKGVSSFFLMGAGWGRIHSDLGSAERTIGGLAVSASLGLRLTPRPGPVGFIFALRSSNVFTSNVTSCALTGTLGLTIHPQ